MLSRTRRFCVLFQIRLPFRSAIVRKESNMSVRRSARISTNSGPSTSEAKDVVSTKRGLTKKPSASTRKRKASSPSTKSADEALPIAEDLEASKPDFAISEPPKTPLPKRRKAAAQASPEKAPPFTPTPAGVSLLVSTRLAHPLEGLVDERPRPAEPHATNAPLSTPGGSRVVAYSSSPVKPPVASQDDNASPTKKRKAKELVPPDVGVLKPPTSTTDTLLSDACEHMCTVDPKLRGLIEKHHCKMFSPEGLSEVVDPFTALASGIIGQQVSGAAASSIRAKFTALFPSTHPSFPTPSLVIQKDIATLRTAGLSQRKAEYIHGLAEKFDSGELSAQMLVSASDEELIEKLVAVRGLGRWSVEMFACFGLKRMDVFSTGDLGVQRGMAMYVGKDVSKLKSKGGKWKYMSEKDMLELAAKFSPYRSLFMWYMWRICDVDISVLDAKATE
ncbi:DNA glycosylase [Massariosphaeria phaeospora]|uniref:DNA glycosylase n=1 Tax=Massariosphaeria phaeospora TaxID=100035 RepID=A0A7C8M997_9PLEO|nr:DNA glycosylase [Massariosphaeria phaeospora]